MRKFIFTILLILVLAFIGFFALQDSYTEKGVAVNNQEEPTSLCYQYLNKTDRDFYDKVRLRLNILGEKVSGRFENILGEKDSKVGDFSGTVGPIDELTMGRTAEVWWDTYAEGINATEELLIEFGDGSASALYGERVDRGDGVYVYRDMKEIFFGPSLSQISCEDMEEVKSVEKYIEENIKLIAKDKATLGGSWYAVSVYVNYTNNSGEVIYEDGHTRRLGTFNYDLDQSSGKVIVINFESKVPGDF